ncbi:MAG: hypothetical protein K2M06_02405 [Muribaculaceae bacterium]|nr:hypothetical protein [Muribaculaceae bacterium]
MSNRRELKKYVHAVCGDLAAGILETSYAFGNVKKSDVIDIVNDIASLQIDTLAKISIAFDKTPSAMEAGEYRKARRAYYRSAAKALLDEFHKSVDEILKKINAALPEEVRAELKAAAK